MSRKKKGKFESFTNTSEYNDLNDVAIVKTIQHKREILKLKESTSLEGSR
jgi:hypothetical protein